ncbi:hypothetical protein [Xanthomonas sacchari]|uniref:hypothetical protein n=1 Tax=Xanthomonas sacchari TaxID=56458 RepID=UPI002256CDDB|nr:hypothetical protein [Xanthomonas sacchari]MCW0462969.1 hypothetical protein [Xanthomonas sacchari]
MDKAKHALKTVEEYSDAFRDMVNECVQWKDEPARRLKLEKDEDWSFVCVAMDILGDASLAIDNFLRFGLDGPTKYDEAGEKYLRLYGLLGATYSQQRAALKLHKLTSCPGVKQFQGKAKRLRATVLRHQIAAHSLDNMDEQGKVVAAFVPVRIDLGGFNCTVTKNRGDEMDSYDLLVVIEEHSAFVAEVMDVIYEKCAKTFFKNDSTRRLQHLEKLEELRAIRNGVLVFNAGGTRVVVNIVNMRREEGQGAKTRCSSHSVNDPMTD